MTDRGDDGDRASRAQQIAVALLDRRGVDAPSAAAAVVPSSSPATAPALDYPHLQRSVRWFDGLLRIHHAAATLAAARSAPLAADDHKPEGEIGVLCDAIRTAHLVLLAHPVAAKAAYASLAAEGRQFAQTVEGAALRACLEQSPRLRRAALLWRGITMGLLDEDERALPATYLDNLLRSVDRADLERVIGLAYHNGGSPP